MPARWAVEKVINPDDGIATLGFWQTFIPNIIGDTSLNNSGNKEIFITERDARVFGDWDGMLSDLARQFIGEEFRGKSLQEFLDRVLPLPRTAKMEA